MTKSDLVGGGPSRVSTRVARAALAALVPISALLAMPLPAAAAESQEPITWVVLDQLKPGSTRAWVKLVTENYGPVIDQAMADGNVLSWGLLQRATGGSDFTHAGWVTYKSWAAAAELDKAFAAKFAAMSPEDQAEISAGFAAATEPHRAMIRYLRGVVFEVRPDSSPAAYIMVSDWQANPGKGQAARALYDEVRPGFAKAMASGAISGYGLYVQELHDGGSSHVNWYTLPDLASIPRVDAAIQEVMSEDMPARMAETFDMSAHRDTLWEVLHWGAPPAEGGGGSQ